METKPLHDSDGRLQYANRKKTMETATGNFGLELRNLGRMDNSKKVQNNEHRVPEERREEMDTEKNGVTKTTIENFLTIRPDVVTIVTVIKQVSIGSDHRMLMSNIKLGVAVERNK